MLLIPFLVVGCILARRSKRQAWRKFVAPRLSEDLVSKKKAYLFWISYALLMLAFVCFILALARPYKGESKSFDKIKSRNIMIMMDVSKSMLCQDVSPDRLTAAKSLSLQLLESFPNDHVGVIAFAGSSHIIAPLTIDHAAVHDSLSQLDSDSVAIDGSNLSEAAIKGVEALKATGQRANALVIFSDGTESDEGIDKVARTAEASGVQIFCVGAGTPAGGIIPSEEDPSGKHRNQEGQVVHTKLEAQVLRQLAESTSGIYTSINSNPDKTIAAALNKMEQFEQDGRERVIPNELYMWFLAPGAFILLLSCLVRAKWRLPKSSVPALAALMLCVPESSYGGEWWDEAKAKFIERPAREQQGYKKLQKEEFEDALADLRRARSLSSGQKHAELSQAIGEIQFRLGNYPQAAREYSSSLLSEKADTQQKAYYNIGNSLYQQQWSQLKVAEEQSLEDYLIKAVEETDPENIPPLELKALDTLEKGFTNALAKYNDSLSIRPEDEATLNNKKLTEQNIRDIKNARKQLTQTGGDGGQQKDEQQKDEQQKDEQQKDEQQKDDQQKDDQQKDDQQKDDQQKDDQQKDDQQKDDQQKDDQQKDDQQKDDQQKDDQQKDDQQKDDQQKDNQQKDDQQEPSTNSEQSKDGRKPPQERPLTPEELAKQLDPNLSKEERARELLELHSDLQKPPGKNYRSWRRRPKIDW
ncbi:hypothetical protein Rhal01_03560 [Rubritalea halochordaticola]|uniref:VWFA domain-containing protein n=1 Tax=Rubritalea halochordaticola TaxID=714537 RepID=A0ABP9V3Y2_9BACT